MQVLHTQYRSILLSYILSWWRNFAKCDKQSFFFESTISFLFLKTSCSAVTMLRASDLFGFTRYVTWSDEAFFYNEVKALVHLLARGEACNVSTKIIKVYLQNLELRLLHHTCIEKSFTASAKASRCLALFLKDWFPLRWRYLNYPQCFQNIYSIIILPRSLHT